MEGDDKAGNHEHGLRGGTQTQTEYRHSYGLRQGQSKNMTDGPQLGANLPQGERVVPTHHSKLPQIH